MNPFYSEPRGEVDERKAPLLWLPGRAKRRSQRLEALWREAASREVGAHGAVFEAIDRLTRMTRRLAPARFQAWIEFLKRRKESSKR